ncbi:ABC transporter ATP-binding protein [Treponema pedis]|uniref:ABC transporter ATP-binding protein n=1 Tax=Treponema pedis str. T A4 TaxID=1291379 RepID=S5ZS17_9SPIR|nr:ABC transporter ATP-binding protein [Treponema pedis]AGT42855.1 ABC transporter ATP-binding protein [Treponema pedis str. T A4]
MLEIKNLTKYYGSGKNKITACNNVSFELKAGQITSLLGLNGAGKSSIINCISGYCLPDKGDILIGGYSVLKDETEAKRRIGVLYEQTPLYSYMTVSEFLNFSAQMRGIAQDKIKDKIEEAVEFCELEEVYERTIKGLSKGYKQRVGLAQAVLHNPPLIILDEPTSGLDAIQMRLFEKKILQIAKEKTVLISTHNLKQAAALCSNHILLNKGTVISSGNIADIKEQMLRADCPFTGSHGEEENILEKAFYFFAGVNKNEFGKIENI